MTQHPGHTDLGTGTRALSLRVCVLSTVGSATAPALLSGILGTYYYCVPKLLHFYSSKLLFLFLFNLPERKSLPNSLLFLEMFRRNHSHCVREFPNTTSASGLPRPAAEQMHVARFTLEISPFCPIKKPFSLVTFETGPCIAWAALN